MATSDVQLLTFWASPYAVRAELALAAKGIPYTKLPQDLAHKSSLLLQSNPVYKKIPVLLHNGKSICESTVIVQYLDDAFPSPDGGNLLPEDPHDRAVARFWADFVDKKFLDALSRALRSAGDEQKAALQETKEHLSTLVQGALQGTEHEYFFGGARVGYVDIILGPLVAWYEATKTVGNCNLELEKWPRLLQWMKAMRESALGECLPASDKITEFTQMMQRRRLQAAQ